MSAVLAAATAGAACGAGVGELLLARAERRRRSADRGGGTIGAVAPREVSTIDQLGGLGALVRIGRRIGGGAGARLPRPVDAAARLDAAGLSPTVTAADLGALRGAGMVIGAALALVLLPVAGAAGLLLSALAPVALVLVPDLLIGRRIRDRGAAMLQQLPDAIDLLRIALRGGRSVPEALAAVGAHHHGVLGAELRRTAAEIRIGVAGDRALVALRRRCPADGAAELVAVLLRTHLHGDAATVGLRSLAEDLRARRARAAIDRAARAAPKVQLVVALLLVPAAMLLIAAAMIQMQR